MSRLTDVLLGKPTTEELRLTETNSALRHRLIEGIRQFSEQVAQVTELDGQVSYYKGLWIEAADESDRLNTRLANAATRNLEEMSEHADKRRNLEHENAKLQRRIAELEEVVSESDLIDQLTSAQLEIVALKAENATLQSKLQRNVPRARDGRFVGSSEVAV